MSYPHSLFKYLQNEEPMESALNSAHSSSRRADKHLKYGRYDEAIKCHSETVNFLSKAIAESTIPKNIENLLLQRKHHENIQTIIVRQKQEFADFLRRNGLKAISKRRDHTQKENQEHRTVIGINPNDNCDKNTSDDNKFFSLVGDLKIEEKFMDKEMVQVKDEESDDDDDEYVSLQ
ncbi:nuclear receptor-binding factor 2-like isoform X1 [Bradysia coprophila]|uniref:nuclear receptor-binding factor 2-like isoform X1 n=1 Tax=Bradysia coprophila TaxID=38358 RepID=UPI00187D92A6|nr:nuclear receptor-binding factor 2-like isoform X1 [Bradysia coprophila]